MFFSAVLILFSPFRTLQFTTINVFKVNYENSIRFTHFIFDFKEKYIYANKADTCIIEIDVYLNLRDL